MVEYLANLYEEIQHLSNVKRVTGNDAKWEKWEDRVFLSWRSKNILNPFPPNCSKFVQEMTASHFLAIIMLRKTIFTTKKHAELQDHDSGQPGILAKENLETRHPVCCSCSLLAT